MAVRAALRPYEGFNAHARYRQRDQHSFGYKLDNFVTDEGDEASEDHSEGEDWECDSDDDATSEECSFDGSESDESEPAQMSNRFSNQSTSIQFVVEDI